MVGAITSNQLSCVWFETARQLTWRVLQSITLTQIHREACHVFQQGVYFCIIHVQAWLENQQISKFGCGQSHSRCSVLIPEALSDCMRNEMQLSDARADVHAGLKPWDVPLTGAETGALLTRICRCRFQSHSVSLVESGWHCFE